MERLCHLLLCWTDGDYLLIERGLIARYFTVDFATDTKHALMMLGGMHRVGHPYEVVLTDCYDLAPTVRTTGSIKDSAVPIVYCSPTRVPIANFITKVVCRDDDLDTVASVLRGVVRTQSATR